MNMEVLSADGVRIHYQISRTGSGANRKYFKDFDYTTINGTGHYPMPENTEEFNRELEKVLIDLE